MELGYGFYVALCCYVAAGKLFFHMTKGAGVKTWLAPVPSPGQARPGAGLP